MIMCSASKQLCNKKVAGLSESIAVCHYLPSDEYNLNILIIAQAHVGVSPEDRPHKMRVMEKLEQGC